MTGRQYLTRAEWDAMLEAQMGVCACGCGQTPADGRFQADHSNPSAFVGGKPDQLLHHRCHALKTKRDVRAIAKAKRLSGETMSQHERRAKFGPALRSRNSFQDRRNG